MKLINKVIVLLIIAGAYYYGYGQISSFQSGNWNDNSTWVGGVVPTQNDDVIIGAGHTVTVPNDYTAKCNNCSLVVNGTETRVAFGNDNSSLEVYGTLSASTTANLQIIDNSSNNSKVIFKRTTDGELFGTWGTATTRLRFEVDCPGATVNLGSGSVTAREIIVSNGTLSLSSSANLRPSEGTSGSGKLTINSGGTISTTALLSRTSSSSVNFNTFSIIGTGTFSTASTSSNGAFYVNNCNFSNSSTIEFRSINQQYIPAATYGDLVLSSGTTNPEKNLVGNITVNGLFSIRGSATFNKSTYSITYGNDAILQYGASGQSTAQTTSDNEWPESNGPKHVRVWNTGGVTLHANRSIPENGVLTLSSGTFNLDGKTLTLGDGATIRRNAGEISAIPTFGTTVNLEYGSTISSVTTGAEVPVDPTKLNDVTISSTQGVTLGSDMTVNGYLNITGSNLTTTNSYAVYLGTSAANPSESTGKSIVGKAIMNQRNIGTGGLNILGVNLAAGTDDIGNVTITRKTGEDGRIAVGENTGINCNWDITVGTQPSSGRDVTFSWLSDFDNDKNMEQATLWKKDGENWNRIIAATNVSGNDPREFAATGITTFSQWTVSDDSSPLPVELISFTAAVSGKSVNLNWQTATELNNYGFEVERSEKQEARNEKWEKVGFVAGYGNSNSTKEYSFSDDISQLLSLYLNPSLTLPKDYTLRYRLKQIDNDGNYSYSNEVIVETLTATSLPTEYALHQNYPNPFNPVTKIDYALKSDANVKVELYSVIGEKISVLISENQNAGNHTFEINASKMRLTSGIYLVRFSATELSGSESYSKVIKMVLNK